MKIVYLITSGDQGGAQKYVLELAVHFNGSIASGVEQSWLKNECAKLGLAYHHLHHLKRHISPWHDVLALWEIYRLLRETQPDLVHVNSSKAGILGSIAGWLTGTKVVFTAHGMYYFNHPSLFVRTVYTGVEWFASRFRNHIIAVSEHDRRQAITHHLLPVKSITTVYNAIHTPNYLPKNQARDILGIPKQATVIGTIANYYRRKGLDLLIDAFQELKLDPSVVCLIIGEGPERTHLESRILPANKHQIRLYGPIEQASSYLKALDIFVLPSRFEGFPYVLLEALAAGLPIISSNAGGSAEAVGNAGLIVPTNNTTELAHAIEKLLSNGQLRKEYEQRSTTQASHFTKTKMQEETRLVYESLLKNN